MKNIVLIAAGVLMVPSAVLAAPINVLWTSGSTAYNANIQELATEAATFDPKGDGNLTWNLTLWDASTGSGPAGGFSAYDVLVIGSSCNFSTGGNCSGTGYFGNGVFLDGIIALEAEIKAARGTRTFLSGQDADWHDRVNRRDRDNGPKGFMINAVNWAASGTGMGIMSMTDRISNDNGWWTAAGSFLATELGDSPFWYNSETVTIGAGQEDFPVNEGLTSAGLSNWRTSSHACFADLPGFTRINFAPRGGAQCGVTIVTAGRESGGTDGGTDGPITPAIPLPASAWLMLGGLGAMVAARRRRG